MIRRTAACAALSLTALQAAALELPLPSGAERIHEEVRAFDSYDLPTGPYADGRVPVRSVQGRIVWRSYRVAPSDLSPLQIWDPVRGQLRARGYEILFECRDAICGGFDFRFAIGVIPAPEMYVDIRNYRFAAAQGPNGAFVSLLISRSEGGAYLQIVSASPTDNETFPLTTVIDPAPTRKDAESKISDNGDRFLARLDKMGHAILHDLEFESGAGRLSAGDYATLQQLADFLASNPGLAIALVGHTDSVGDLTSNIALSKRRAASVRQRLIEDFDVAPEQVEAEGMGYLAPVANNLTPEGREANRRVEVIILRGD